MIPDARKDSDWFKVKAFLIAEMEHRRRDSKQCKHKLHNHFDITIFDYGKRNSATLARSVSNTTLSIQSKKPHFLKCWHHQRFSQVVSCVKVIINYNPLYVYDTFLLCAIYRIRQLQSGYKATIFYIREYKFLFW